jgi:hypothetical protein
MVFDGYKDHDINQYKEPTDQKRKHSLLPESEDNQLLKRFNEGIQIMDLLQKKDANKDKKNQKIYILSIVFIYPILAQRTDIEIFTDVKLKILDIIISIFN